MTDAPQPDPKAGGLKRGLKWLLFASLALNLLFVFAIAGAALRGGPWDNKGPRGAGGYDRDAPYTRAFDADQRDDIRRELRRAFRADGGRGAERAALLADYREALGILRAEDFDANALTQVLSRQTARAETRRAVGQDVLIGYIATMSTEDRLAFADRLEAGIARLVARTGKGRD